MATRTALLDISEEVLSMSRQLHNAGEFVIGSAPLLKELNEVFTQLADAHGVGMLLIHEQLATMAGVVEETARAMPE
ncbi:hypothetical protein [Amycolatopsis minnesotensis]|uniref:Uncharacterized protein n=1 Tax=Amycolatopsis minnesotensis TaxID=337894 RepID=A0ABP5EE04_9PSEU